MKFITIIKILRFLLFLVIIGIVVYFLGSHLLQHTVQKISKDMIVICKKSAQSKIIIIDEKGFHPEVMTMKACDILIFRNTGSLFHEPAFGDHPKHLLYPGFHEKEIKSGEINAVVMTAVGIYKIHDHIYDELEGQIVVER